MPVKDESRSLLDWFLDGGRLAVADCQRSYEWPESLVADFVEDLIAKLSHEAPGVPDIGVVVLERDDEGGYCIIDGQQRLLTSALFMLEVCGPGALLQTDCRLRRLLSEPAGNFQTVLHARQARRQIRGVLARRRLFRKEAGEDERLAFLRPITFSFVEFERRQGKAPDDGVVRFFKPLNTTQLPLNGGQILKAHHMGRICKGRTDEIWRLQSQYDAWMQRKEDGRNDKALGLTDFHPVTFNTDEKISITRFVDSPGQEAWYFLGCGFVQAVQALLLGQDDWWLEIARQGAERQSPYERLEGSARPCPGAWSAARPLEFAEGEGFIRMLDRFGRLFNAYVRELQALPADLQAPSEACSAGPDDMDCDRRPARLVCEAARHAAAFGSALARWCRDDVDRLAVPVLGDFCRFADKRRVEIDGSFANPRSLLGLPEQGGCLSNVFGCIPTAVFASALAWSERFARREDDAAIKRLLILQLLHGRTQSRSRSVLNALAASQAVAAAGFSLDVQSALWRLIKKWPWRFQSWASQLEPVVFRMRKELRDASEAEVEALDLLHGALLFAA